MIDLSQKMDSKNPQCEILCRTSAAVRHPAFRILSEREWRIRLWRTNPKFESNPDRTTHESRITTYHSPITITTHQVFRIGCASVLKIVRLKSKVSGGAKRR